MVLEILGIRNSCASVEVRERKFGDSKLDFQRSLRLFRRGVGYLVSLFL